MVKIYPMNDYVLVREDLTPSAVAKSLNSGIGGENPEPVTGRVLELSKEQMLFEDYYVVAKYDRVLYSPVNLIQIELSKMNYVYLVPFDNLLAVFKSEVISIDFC